MPQAYQIQSGDTIGIKFTGGSSSNNISITRDTANSFDGTNSYYTSYTTSWQTSTGQDIYMILKTHLYSGGPTVTALPTTGTYNPPLSVKLVASEPSTVYYTTDGSTPTTSSTNAPSPVSLTVNTNSTVKFFAKDASNNASPVSSATYTIIPATTVSALPAGGTYTAAQLVTLTASRPSSTIYYTTDGSTPTTSSTNAPSPVSLTVNTNSTLKYFAKDSFNNLGPIGTSTYTITYPVVTQMNDTTASSTLSVYSSTQIRAENVSSTSVLVGKTIDSITIRLSKAGSPSGTVQVGVFNTNLSVKQLFGSFNANTLTTTSTLKTYSLPSLQTYTIQPGDKIGIKFTGGSSSNNVLITVDTGNHFDGTNSYLSSYTTSWQSLTAQDLYMILKTHAY